MFARTSFVCSLHERPVDADGTCKQESRQPQHAGHFHVRAKKRLKQLGHSGISNVTIARAAGIAVGCCWERTRTKHARTRAERARGPTYLGAEVHALVMHHSLAQALGGGHTINVSEHCWVDGLAK